MAAPLIRRGGSKKVTGSTARRRVSVEGVRFASSDVREDGLAPPMTTETPRPIFEIPDTEQSRAFVARNPRFPDALLKLFETANKCFGRNPHPKSHLENVCFWLGHTCRQDFCEIVFLAVNGYGAGATKILRSLYERAVTIEYLIQNPNKIDRFLQFAALQENKAMEAALKQIPADQIDARWDRQIRLQKSASATNNTRARLRRRLVLYAE